jgi:AraC-like DNA-binding protein
LQQQAHIIRQHEEQANHAVTERQQLAKKTDEATEPDRHSKKLLSALEQLFESEKIYRKPKLNINDVADKLGTNRTYLSKVINSYHQKNFSEYVNHYRIQDAKDIFKAQSEGNFTNYTNELIAEKVGFAGPAPFYRAFKHEVGITSMEYKKLIEQMKQNTNNEYKSLTRK